MNGFTPELSDPIAAILARLGQASNVPRPLSIRTDSFVGDQFLFLEVLRSEVLRDATSSNAAIMLRVSRAINNRTLCALFDQLAPRLAIGSPSGKRRADILEAIIGALVIESDFSGAEQFVAQLYQLSPVPSNLRYPQREIERLELDAFALLAAEGVAMLESRLLLSALQPPIRELHAAAQLLAKTMQPSWRGPKKSPSDCAREISNTLARRGIGAALRVLEAELHRGQAFSSCTNLTEFGLEWNALSCLLKDRMQRGASAHIDRQ
ncbi:MAG: hypothetical protein J0M12_16180 [Deltaproteobacteria bacterium]|nr:hypothetical protein [Deltaproteobacteria bacterium]